MEIEFMLDHESGEPALKPEQEAELERRLADPERQYVSHEDVGEYFAKKYGR